MQRKVMIKINKMSKSVSIYMLILLHCWFLVKFLLGVKLNG